MWFAGRDGDGAVRHWPDAGGLAHQSAWVHDAYALLLGTEAKMRKAEKGNRP